MPSARYLKLCQTKGMSLSKNLKPDSSLWRIAFVESVLVFPHQLFWPHPAIAQGRQVFIVEDSLFFGCDVRWPAKMHRQKLFLHRLSLRAYAERLEREGIRATVLESSAAARHTGRMLEDGLPRATGKLIYADPVDDLIGRRLQSLAARRSWSLEVLDTPQFLTPSRFLEECFDQEGKPFMARFYQKQRQRMNILIEENGAPMGGQWSFDPENRKRLPRGVVVPAPPTTQPANSEEVSKVARGLPDSRGEAAGFSYATTHEQAEANFDRFLVERLAGFGDYEDAISSRHPVLFHSVLTPALNIGLLTPDQVIRKTLDFASSHAVPLNSLEGFVRQIIGWREFMRAMYERHGREMRLKNFWGFKRRMPVAFYSGETGIEPVDDVIRKVLSTGYCHHIERLMILGNFMLLCRIHPDDVYLWFMEMFVDSYDWVMVPNVYGMSQFADGGKFTTKPYFSGSNYILKMSDYKRGPWCEVWDALFWTFVADHREFFASNPRLSMMARSCDRLGAKMTHYRKISEKFLTHLS